TGAVLLRHGNRSPFRTDFVFRRRPPPKTMRAPTMGGSLDGARPGGLAVNPRRSSASAGALVLAADVAGALQVGAKAAAKEHDFTLGEPDPAVARAITALLLGDVQLGRHAAADEELDEIHLIGSGRGV